MGTTPPSGSHPKSAGKKGTKPKEPFSEEPVSRLLSRIARVCLRRTRDVLLRSAPPTSPTHSQTEAQPEDAQFARPIAPVGAIMALPRPSALLNAS
ncbi:hypothetical protein PSPO01_06472 [Paraphaeosphaeria sporulosa]